MRQEVGPYVVGALEICTPTGSASEARLVRAGLCVDCLVGRTPVSTVEVPHQQGVRFAGMLSSALSRRRR